MVNVVLYTGRSINSILFLTKIFTIYRYNCYKKVTYYCWSKLNIPYSYLSHIYYIITEFALMLPFFLNIYISLWDVIWILPKSEDDVEFSISEVQVTGDDLKLFKVNSIQINPIQFFPNKCTMQPLILILHTAFN